MPAFTQPCLSAEAAPSGSVPASAPNASVSDTPPERPETDDALRELAEQHQLAMSKKSTEEASEELKMLQSARHLTPSEITTLLHWLVKREILLSERVERLEAQVEALQKTGSGQS
ncbi:hypothetical protein [Oecophyllibacter saccharovorans]|uniref:hypothetical protein n=1 Tax=Oecophyllibacter saccharovorans TaxID=2558360 RepID=UPI001141AFF8|nr:hypothetical protein [Oecophyllibacter saccharovorans]QDH15145.1 hypothetical protein E3E11_03920 [Oecophyllibacter saccharovorans]TPW33706.1 hypothetical protein E3203_07835 [Oecophyllibacter saccharovorans]